MSIPFFRLNRDQLEQFEIELEPFTPELRLTTSIFSIVINEQHLKSVFFRSPTFIRECKNYRSTDEQIRVSQWSAFTRALMVFEDAMWANHPQATYKAEIKAYQLKKASEVGFKTPQTLITNSPRLASERIDHNNIAFKSIDTVYLESNEQFGFLYTQFRHKKTLAVCGNEIAPLTFQKALIPKIDIRVTVVGDELFPFIITKDNGDICNDWRIEKNSLHYTHIKLPPDITGKIFNLMDLLDLRYCGIDLIKSNGHLYFIEANPTGEWGWLMNNTGTRIDKSIIKLLAQQS